MDEDFCTFRIRAGAVECDANGARVAGIPLLVRGGSGEWRPRPGESIERALMGIYRVAIDAARKMSGLGVVADALNRGEIARAQVATLLLKLPDPGRVDAGSTPGLRKLAVLLKSGWVAEDWDPSKHPRAESGPNPGWFAPKDGDADDAPKPERPAGTEVAEIKPIANPGVASDAPNDVVPVGGGEEERFPWEERDDEGGTYYNPDTGEMRTIPPGSGVVLQEPWVSLDDLPRRRLTLARRRWKRGPIPARSTSISSTTQMSSTRPARKIMQSKPTNFMSMRSSAGTK